MINFGSSSGRERKYINKGITMVAITRIITAATTHCFFEETLSFLLVIAAVSNSFGDVLVAVRRKFTVPRAFIFMLSLTG